MSRCHPSDVCSLGRASPFNLLAELKSLKTAALGKFTLARVDSLSSLHLKAVTWLRLNENYPPLNNTKLASCRMSFRRKVKIRIEKLSHKTLTRSNKFIIASSVYDTPIKWPCEAHYSSPRREIQPRDWPKMEIVE